MTHSFCFTDHYHSLSHSWKLPLRGGGLQTDCAVGDSRTMEKGPSPLPLKALSFLTAGQQDIYLKVLAKYKGVGSCLDTPYSLKYSHILDRRHHTHANSSVQTQKLPARATGRVFNLFLLTFNSKSNDFICSDGTWAGEPTSSNQGQKNNFYLWAKDEFISTTNLSQA